MFLSRLKSPNWWPLWRILPVELNLLKFALTSDRLNSQLSAEIIFAPEYQERGAAEPTWRPGSGQSNISLLRSGDFQAVTIVDIVVDREGAARNGRPLIQRTAIPSISAGL
jgi:hypothetical protein